MSDSNMGHRKSVVLVKRPDGEPRVSDFDLIEEPIPTPAEGEVLTRAIFLSVDPYQRGRISGRASYAAPVPIGGLMEGETVGEVLVSHDPRFQPGDVVLGSRGWQTHTVSKADRLAKVDAKAAPAGAYLGVLGMPGTTAYSGMKDIGQPKPGKTVVISAASGAVGSVAGQIAKRAGCRVIGIAGGPDKCLWVQETLGFDQCLDHRSPDLARQLADACPKGIDVYFENVGGAVQAAVIPLLNVFGRMIMCGMVAHYNDRETAPGPNLMFTVGKRVRIEGLIVSDKPERFAEWRALAAPWVKDGSLKYRETVVDGIENAPEALIELLRGGNFGKMLVRIGPDPA